MKFLIYLSDSGEMTYFCFLYSVWLQISGMHSHWTWAHWHFSALSSILIKLNIVNIKNIIPEMGAILFIAITDLFATFHS
jgi:hypothetical protein